MFHHEKLSRGLRESLLAVVAGTCSREQLNRVVAVSHALADSFLASKSTTHTLRSMYGLSTTDLAYDCIADLFVQDERHAYLQLQSYFSSISLSSMRDEEILSHLRRLVFSKVNQGIFRLYSEADPSLAKILRNVKLAVGSLKNFDEIERFGETCLTPSLCDALEGQPPFEEEDLKQEFCRRTSGNEMIPGLLATLSLLLRDQSERCRILPLVSIGLLFRSVYESKNLAQPVATSSEQTWMTTSDVTCVIQRACSEVRDLTVRKYVESGKVSQDLFNTYFRVIQKETCNRLLGNDGQEGSLLEGMRQEIPELQKEEYHEIHRNRVEYLLKLVQKKAVKELRAQ